LPLAARATSAICVESAAGIPICSRTASSRDADRERGDDQQCQQECRAGEAASIRRPELTELSDCRGRRLRAGCQCHRDREREEHGDDRRTLRPGDRRSPVTDDGVAEPVNEHDEGASDEEKRHDCECQPAAMPEPRKRGHSEQ